MHSRRSVIGKSEPGKAGRSPTPRAQRQNQNVLWNYGKPSHLPIVPKYGDDRDGYTYDSEGPSKAKTKAKNSLDSKTEKSDNGECYVTD